MGLFSKLQNGDTVLKSLKFGNDRPGGGNSGQPYIKNPLIDEPGKLSHVDDDFLLRGGLRAPINAIEDVARLTKYMFDFKSPKGLLFIAKQNLLSRVSVATEASISAGYANNPSKELAWTKAPLNQGIYTPLSTIVQAGVGYSGLHLNLLGINPFTPMTGIVQGGFLPGIGLVRYEDVVRGKTRLTKTIEVDKVITPPPSRNSRAKVDGFDSYRNINKITVKEKQKVPIGQYENRLIYLWGKDMTNTDNAGGTVLTYSGGPGSVLGIGKTKIKFADQRTGLNNPLSSTEFKYFYEGGNKLHEDEFTPNYTGLLQASIAQGLTYEEIGIKADGTLGGEDKPRLYGPSSPNSTLSKDQKGLILTGPNGYQIGNNPKKQTQGSTYTENTENTVDRIYYDSARKSNPIDSGDDLIKFSITVINPTAPNGTGKPLKFRAYIDSFSDSYSADWKSQTYMGRAESFYKYNSFGRDMSLSFKIVADNEFNLTGSGQMYDQLNTLASSLAPTYTTYGYMAGNLHKLTVGNYISNQTGIINSLSYDIMDESPWEISPDKQLPMYIAVSVKFTPIHNFRPEMKWGNNLHKFINQA